MRCKLVLQDPGDAGGEVRCQPQAEDATLRIQSGGSHDSGVCVCVRVSLART